MALDLFRRCLMTCCFDSQASWECFSSNTLFTCPLGEEYEIHSITSSYDPLTKEANVYVETERMRQSLFISYAESVGATSMTLKIFPHKSWRKDSSEALHAIISRAESLGLPLVKNGSNPLAATPTVLMAPMKQAGIYVLRLDNTPRPFFYVGKATNITVRIQQHQNGTGAYCISGEPFTRVDPVTTGSTDDMESWERNEVLTRMFEFGIDNVRGWMYTLKTMPIEQKLSAFDQICEKFDRCRKCGRGTHFVRDCQALSADLWTNGMELRMAYPPSTGAQQQTLVQLADAERRIAEAAKVLTGRLP